MKSYKILTRLIQEEDEVLTGVKGPVVTFYIIILYKTKEKNYYWESTNCFLERQDNSRKMITRNSLRKITSWDCNGRRSNKSLEGKVFFDDIQELIDYLDTIKTSTYFPYLKLIQKKLRHLRNSYLNGKIELILE